MAIFGRTGKAVIRAMCGVKFLEKRRSKELMSLLGLKDTLDGLARASAMRRYGHVLRRDNDEVLKRALDFEVVGKRGRERTNMTWKREVEKHIDKMN